jgi:hypothetical protein
VAALDALEAEVNEIDDAVPTLEEDKKRAVAKRDFKEAGRASKTLKEMQSRRQACDDEINGTATTRVSQSTAVLQACVAELEEKQRLYTAVEAKLAQRRMTQLAEQIHMLMQIKDGVCLGAGDQHDTQSKEEEEGKSATSSLLSSCRVAAMGATVLEDEVQALTLEGQALGDRFGGWETNLARLRRGVSVEENSGESKAQATESEDDADTNQSPSNIQGFSNHGQDGDTGADKPPALKPTKITITTEIISTYQELQQKVKESEQDLEEAVANEDYDKAAEVDGGLQDLQSQLEALGCSSDDIERALDERNSAKMADEEEGETASDVSKENAGHLSEDNSLDNEKENSCSDNKNKSALQDKEDVGDECQTKETEGETRDTNTGAVDEDI